MGYLLTGTYIDGTPVYINREGGMIRYKNGQPKRVWFRFLVRSI